MSGEPPIVHQAGASSYADLTLPVPINRGAPPPDWKGSPTQDEEEM